MCFLWVCGILAHNSCSSQVTAPFSRTYLAFLPRHDYHTPSTLGLAMRDISIIPGWNWSNVPEMSNSPPPPPLPPKTSLLYPTSTPRFPPTPLSSLYTLLPPHPPAQIPAALQWESSSTTLFLPLSQLFVSAGMIGSFGSDISSVTSC